MPGRLAPEGRRCCLAPTHPPVRPAENPHWPGQRPPRPFPPVPRLRLSPPIRPPRGPRQAEQHGKRPPHRRAPTRYRALAMTTAARLHAPAKRRASRQQSPEKHPPAPCPKATTRRRASRAHQVTAKTPRAAPRVSAQRQRLRRQHPVRSTTTTRAIAARRAALSRHVLKPSRLLSLLFHASSPNPSAPLSQRPPITRSRAHPRDRSPPRIRPLPRSSSARQPPRLAPSTPRTLPAQSRAPQTAHQPLPIRRHGPANQKLLRGSKHERFPPLRAARRRPRRSNASPPLTHESPRLNPRAARPACTSVPQVTAHGRSPRPASRRLA